MPLLSIIIPVFNNTKKEIENCLKSILNGRYDYTALEILIVDDGSEASCAEFLDNFTIDFFNIKVFHQKNKGVSHARNFGIKMAKGQYLSFVDADDMVTPNFVEDAIWMIMQSGLAPDIVYGFVEYVETPRDFYRQVYNNCICDSEYTMLSKEDKDKLFYHFFDLSESGFRENKYYLSRGPIARLVRKELASKCQFDESLTIGEDPIWNLEILKRINSAVLVKRLWYYYIANCNSASRKLNKNSIQQFENFLTILHKYAISDKAKSHLLNKTIAASIEVARGYFLTDEFQGSFFLAVKEFNHLFCFSPWNLALKFKYAVMRGWKCIIKYLLIRTGLFLYVIKLKYKM